MPSVTVLRPSASTRQKDSRLSAPGNRHAIPTIAIGGPGWKPSLLPPADRAGGCVDGPAKSFNVIGLS